MRVQDTSEPYFDPLTGDFRIESHYHSNVATSRKNTFVGRWAAATYRIEASGELWKYSADYLRTLESKMVSKGGVATRVPAPDLLAWLYRRTPIAPHSSVEDLTARFIHEFKLSSVEFETLFSRAPLDGRPDGHAFFSDHQILPALEVAAVTDGDRFDLTVTLDALEPAEEDTVKLPDIVELIAHGRGQLVLQGPPGTGKTYMARRAAAVLLGLDPDTAGDPDALDGFLEERQLGNLPAGSGLADAAKSAGGAWEIVQFHPSYSYEDFVRGITVTLEGDRPVFRNEDRIFGILARLSVEVDVPLVLIIDEINRGDLSKVLGELIYALEYRGTAIRSMYEVNKSALITVGDNLKIIATMNTADRSIALIDYAIRRRFDFVELVPDRQALEEVVKGGGLASTATRVMELYDKVQTLYPDGSDFAVGHSYFMAKDTGVLARQVVFQVLPLLAEYAKEGILRQATSIPLEGWPGEGLSLHPQRPFELVTEIKTWLDGGEPLS